MKDLFITLPPFSPDYCGVASTLFELGGIVVIHDGTGCTGNYICHDEPRGYGSQSAIYTSNLREMEVVFGDDEVFLNKIVQADKDLDAPFIALLSSPVPMIIGTDFKALGRIVHRRTGKPVFTFDTHGIAFYDEGQAESWLTLAKAFSKPCEEKNIRHVNILGATPLDLGAEGQMTLLKEFLYECGAEKVTSWGMEGTLEDIEQVGKASLNLVIHVSGLSTAQWMEENLGIPYMVGLPIGKQESKALKDQIRSCLKIELKEDSDANANVQPILAGKKVLVIHEQVTANAWRECLMKDYGAGAVDVATYFTLNSQLASEGDVHLCEEVELDQLIREQGYDLVLGDRLLSGAVTADVQWIHVPHLAVSGCMHWEKDFRSVYETGYEYLKTALNC